MHLTKCDLCKKEIKNSSHKVIAGIGYQFTGKELCLQCGKPVVDFLLKKKLISKDEAKS